MLCVEVKMVEFGQLPRPEAARAGLCVAGRASRGPLAAGPLRSAVRSAGLAFCHLLCVLDSSVTPRRRGKVCEEELGLPEDTGGVALDTGRYRNACG